MPYSFPIYHNFCTITHTGFKFTDGFKTICLRNIRNEICIHKPATFHTMLQVRGSLWVINCAPFLRVFVRIIPGDRMVMGNKMSTSRCMTRFMTKYDCFPFCIIFYCNPVPAFPQLEIISPGSIGWAKKNLILRFIGIWLPFPAVGAPSAFFN